MMGPEQIRNYLASSGDTTLNLDDNAFLEYFTPFEFLHPTKEIVAALEPYAGFDPALLVNITEAERTVSQQRMGITPQADDQRTRLSASLILFPPLPSRELMQNPNDCHPRECITDKPDNLQGFLAFRTTVAHLTLPREMCCVCQSTSQRYGVRRQRGAATALWLNATRKEIDRPMAQCHSGVVAPLFPALQNVRDELTDGTTSRLRARFEMATWLNIMRFEPRLPEISVYIHQTAAKLIDFDMRKWIILIAILGAGFGGYSLWNNWQKTKLSAATPSRPTTAPAELRDISFAVNAAGEITPAEQVSVRPEINGLIESLPGGHRGPVKEGRSAVQAR